MPPAVLSAFCVFAFIASITPGPNNILALSTGTRCGFQRALPVLLGIFCGFYTVMLLCGGALYGLSQISPFFLTVMRVVGAVYLLWLAWKVGTATPSTEADAAPTVNFWQAALLQAVNVKIIVYAMTAFSGFIFPYHHDAAGLLLGGLALALMGSVGTFSWALAGAILKRFLQRHARAANAVMGVLLAGCAVSIVWQY